MTEHPLGIQPWGNFLFAEDKTDVRNKGLGALHVLPDELLLDIVGRLDAVSLANAAGTCKVCTLCAYGPSS